MSRLIFCGMSFKAKHGIWHRLNVKRKPAEKDVYKIGKTHNQVLLVRNVKVLTNYFTGIQHLSP